MYQFQKKCFKNKSLQNNYSISFYHKTSVQTKQEENFIPVLDTMTSQVI